MICTWELSLAVLHHSCFIIVASTTADCKSLATCKRKGGKPQLIYHIWIWLSFLPQLALPLCSSTLFSLLVARLLQSVLFYGTSETAVVTIPSIHNYSHTPRTVVSVYQKYLSWHSWTAKKQSGLTHKCWVSPPPNMRIPLKMHFRRCWTFRNLKFLTTCSYGSYVCFLLHICTIHAISSTWFWVRPLCFSALQLSLLNVTLVYWIAQ